MHVRAWAQRTRIILHEHSDVDHRQNLKTGLCPQTLYSVSTDLVAALFYDGEATAHPHGTGFGGWGKFPLWVRSWI